MKAASCKPGCTTSTASGAKMIPPCAGWLFPPQLVERTGSLISTFSGGSQNVLIEFATVLSHSR